MGVLELLIGPVMQVVDKLIPDPQKKAELQLELIKAQQEGTFKELDAVVAISKGQNEVNAVEAASPSLLKAGWRPFIGWVCGSGLVYSFILSKIVPWAVTVASTALGNPIVVPAMPELDVGTLMTLLFGMLGLGGLRTFEKFKGVA